MPRPACLLLAVVLALAPQRPFPLLSWLAEGDSSRAAGVTLAAAQPQLQLLVDAGRVQMAAAVQVYAAPDSGWPTVAWIPATLPGLPLNDAHWTSADVASFAAQWSGQRASPLNSAPPIGSLDIAQLETLPTPTPVPPQPATAASCPVQAVAVAEAAPLSVFLDLWLTFGDPARKRPVSRAIPASASHMLFPAGTGDTRPGMGTRPPTSLEGLAGMVWSVVWEARGVPANPAASSGGPQPTPHIVTFSTDSTRLTIPALSLRPNYVYSLTANASAALIFAYEYGLFQATSATQYAGWVYRPEIVYLPARTHRAALVVVVPGTSSADTSEPIGSYSVAVSPSSGLALSTPFRVTYTGWSLALASDPSRLVATCTPATAAVHRGAYFMASILLPNEALRVIGAVVGGGTLPSPDLSRYCPAPITWSPQWYLAAAIAWSGVSTSPSIQGCISVGLVVNSFTRTVNTALSPTPVTAGSRSLTLRLLLGTVLDNTFTGALTRLREQPSAFVGHAVTGIIVPNGGSGNDSAVGTLPFLPEMVAAAAGGAGLTFPCSLVAIDVTLGSGAGSGRVAVSAADVTLSLPAAFLPPPVVDSSNATELAAVNATLDRAMALIPTQPVSARVLAIAVVRALVQSTRPANATRAVLDVALTAVQTAAMAVRVAAEAVRSQLAALPPTSAAAPITLAVLQPDEAPSEVAAAVANLTSNGGWGWTSAEVAGLLALTRASLALSLPIALPSARSGAAAAGAPLNVSSLTPFGAANAQLIADAIAATINLAARHLAGNVTVLLPDDGSDDGDGGWIPANVTAAALANVSAVTNEALAMLASARLRAASAPPGTPATSPFVSAPITIVTGALTVVAARVAPPAVPTAAPSPAASSAVAASPLIALPLSDASGSPLIGAAAGGITITAATALAAAATASAWAVDVIFARVADANATLLNGSAWSPLPVLASDLALLSSLVAAANSGNSAVSRALVAGVAQSLTQAAEARPATAAATATLIGLPGWSAADLRAGALPLSPYAPIASAIVFAGLRDVFGARVAFSSPDAASAAMPPLSAAAVAAVAAGGSIGTGNASVQLASLTIPGLGAAAASNGDNSSAPDPFAGYVPLNYTFQCPGEGYGAGLLGIPLAMTVSTAPGPVPLIRDPVVVNATVVPGLILLDVRNVTFRNLAASRPASRSLMPLESLLPWVTIVNDLASYLVPDIAAQYTRVVTVPLYTYRAWCGGAFGWRPVACGPGHYNTSITFSCPVVTTLPTCAYFDTRTGAWSDVGCVTAGVSAAGAVTCNCSHFTNFAARFSRVAVTNAALFATSNSVDNVSRFSWAPHAFILLACLIALNACCFTISHFQDALAEKKMVLALLRDGEVQLASVVTRSSNKRFVVDSLLDEKLGVDGAPFVEADTDSVGRKVVGELQRWLEYMRTQEELMAVSGDALAAGKRGRDDDYSAPVVAAQHLWVHSKRKEVFSVLMGAYSQCGVQPHLWATGMNGALMRRALATKVPTMARSASKASAGTGDTAPRLLALADADGHPRHMRHHTCACPVCQVSGYLIGYSVAMASLQAEQEASLVAAEAAAAIAAQQTKEAAAARKAAATTAAAKAPARPTLPASVGSGGPGLDDDDEDDEADIDVAVKRRAGLVTTSAGGGGGGGGGGAASSGVATGSHHVQPRRTSLIDGRMDTPSTVAIRGCWPTTRAVVRMWGARMWLSHLYTSWLFTFDPLLPRYLRIEVLLSVLFGSLLLNAVLYGYRTVATEGASVKAASASLNDLGPMTVSEMVVVAIITAICQLPIEWTAKALAILAGRSAFAWRHPGIADELRRRSDVEKLMSGFSPSEMAAASLVVTPRSVIFSSQVNDPPTYLALAHSLAATLVQAHSQRALAVSDGEALPPPPPSVAAAAAAATSAPPATSSARAVPASEAPLRHMLLLDVAACLRDMARAPSSKAVALHAATRMGAGAGAGTGAPAAPPDGFALRAWLAAVPWDALVVAHDGAATRARCGAASGRTRSWVRLSSIGQGHSMLAATLLRKAASRGRVAGCRVSCCTCTPPLLVMHAVVAAWLLFCLYYLLLFGLLQPAAALQSFVFSWVASQLASLFLAQPVTGLARTLAWLKCVPRLRGRCPCVRDMPRTTAGDLTARLTTLVVPQSAGLTAGLSPDVAADSFTSLPALATAVASAEMSPREVAHVNARRRALAAVYLSVWLRSVNEPLADTRPGTGALPPHALLDGPAPTAAATAGSGGAGGGGARTAPAPPSSSPTSSSASGDERPAAAAVAVAAPLLTVRGHTATPTHSGVRVQWGDVNSDSDSGVEGAGAAAPVVTRAATAGPSALTAKSSRHMAAAASAGALGERSASRATPPAGAGAMPTPPAAAAVTTGAAVSTSAVTAAMARVERGSAAMSGDVKRKSRSKMSRAKTAGAAPRAGRAPAVLDADAELGVDAGVSDDDGGSSDDGGGGGAVAALEQSRGSGKRSSKRKADHVDVRVAAAGGEGDSAAGRDGSGSGSRHHHSHSHKSRGGDKRAMTSYALHGHGRGSSDPRAATAAAAPAPAPAPRPRAAKTPTAAAAAEVPLAPDGGDTASVLPQWRPAAATAPARVATAASSNVRAGTGRAAGGGGGVSMDDIDAAIF